MKKIAEQGQTYYNPQSTGKQRILIVDDSPENIRVLGQALKSEYRVSFATSGGETLDIAMSDIPCDLILLDIMMPEMDGYEVCRRLKSDRKTRNIPVIFITAMSGEEDETRGLEAGAVDYITKPFSSAIVKARVRTHLELKRHRDMLEHLSSLDGLTGIPNRRRLDEFINIEWRLASRQCSSMSFIMIDIDFFKEYNDNYGHWAGDDCLKHVAKTIAGSVMRPKDFTARYGGEEFAAVLPETDIEGATHVAETIRKNIENLNIPHAYSRTADYITVSLGAATVIPSENISPADLIERADEALFEAKKTGKNRLKTVDMNISNAGEIRYFPASKGN